MKVITLNVNGIRASEKKGLMTWLVKQKPDFVCLQELKAHKIDLENKHLNLEIDDIQYTFSLFCAKKKGYSGVGIFSKKKPSLTKYGMGVREFDNEGRVLRCDYDDIYKKYPLLSIISLYFPSGSASDLRQESKFRFLKSITKNLSSWIDENKISGREFILCGDWNIAHTELDLKNWKNNKKNSGFLPEERSWLSEVVFCNGWTDVFRFLKPDFEQYTWWSQRGRARENNVGWRIDYQIGTKKIAKNARFAFVETKPLLSDHAPLIIEYKSN